MVIYLTLSILWNITKGLSTSVPHCWEAWAYLGIICTPQFFLSYQDKTGDSASIATKKEMTNANQILKYEHFIFPVLLKKLLLLTQPCKSNLWHQRQCPWCQPPQFWLLWCNTLSTEVRLWWSSVGLHPPIPFDLLCGMLVQTYWGWHLGQGGVP